MPAPNLETLLDFETNIESAAKEFLETETGLPSSSIFATLDQTTYTLPRVAVAFELGEALDPTDFKDGITGDREYSKQTGTLTMSVTSDASQDGSQSQHRNLRGKVRKAMLLNSENWSTPDALPYYAIKYQRPTGTAVEIEGDHLTSEMTFDIQFFILSDAWPD